LPLFIPCSFVVDAGRKPDVQVLNPASAKLREKIYQKRNLLTINIFIDNEPKHIPGVCYLAASFCGTGCELSMRDSS